MERLTQKDWKALLKCLREIYAPLDLKTFQALIPSVLPRLVPSDATSYNEINLLRRRVVAVTDPPEWLFAGSEEIFVQHVHEHPVIARHQKSRDGRALKISDFMTQRQLHRLGLYNEFYRLLGIEYQMAMALRSASPLVIGVSLNRSSKDFSERDRLLLNLFRPHLIQAYRNAEMATGLLQAVDMWDRGLTILTGAGWVELMTPRARQWLTEYFGRLPRHGSRLPDDLWRRVRYQCSLLAQDSELPTPLELVIEREGKSLVIRLLADNLQDRLLLLFEERRTAFSAGELESLGLGHREAEVLFWVAEGKTNPEIGIILGLSSRTVKKHLERVYQKLGVFTRTAAAMQALETLGILRR